MKEVRQRLGPAPLFDQLIADQEMPADELEVAEEAKVLRETRIVSRSRLSTFTAFATLRSQDAERAGGGSPGRRYWVGGHLRGNEHGRSNADPHLTPHPHILLRAGPTRPAPVRTRRRTAAGLGGAQSSPDQGGGPVRPWPGPRPGSSRRPRARRSAERGRTGLAPQTVRGLPPC